MKNYAAPRMSALSPYTAGEQPREKQYIKLNTNENPYPPSPKIKRAVEDETDKLNLYPDPDSSELCKAAAAAENYASVGGFIEPENVFCGNGSDEVLSFAFYAFFGGLGGERPLLFPDITYSFYPVYSKFYGVEYQTQRLDANFEIDVKNYLRPASGVVFPNPNAPTSVLFGLEGVEEICAFHEKNETAVVIDEAYIAFSGDNASAVSLIPKYPNLLVTRTLSKSHGLAGLRLGYALGQKHLIDALRRVKDSFNSYPVDRLAAVAGKAAIEDAGYLADTIKKITATRERFINKLRDVGFLALDSKANFVFVSHEKIGASDLYANLKRDGVLARYFNKERIDNFLRISIGTDAEMDAVADILRGYIKSGLGVNYGVSS